MMEVNDRNKEGEDKVIVKPDGPQGVDKAPGEETATNTNDDIRQSQKEKTVDADLTDPSDTV